MRSARSSTPFAIISRTTPNNRMPVYAITPRRSMHHYHPFAPIFGAPQHNSPCVRRTANPASLVPSLFRSLEEDFASMDDLFNSLVSPTGPAIRNFQPRFDVREESDAFHLQGEIPGVDPQNLQVEFVDRNTMVVKGRSVRETKRGNTPASVEQQQQQPAQVQAEAHDNVQNKGKQTEDTMETEPTNTRPGTPDSTSSSTYHKPSVEDEEAPEDFVNVQAETANTTNATATAESQAQPSQQAPATTTEQVVAPQKEQQQADDSHYWVSERSVGEFQRSFRFPGQVDQDGVKASLKDGILNVVVPKVKATGPRKITVE